MKIYAAIGVVVVAVVLGLTIWSNQGSRLILEGSIQKVRLQRVEDTTSVAVVEFRVSNPTDYPYFVKSAQLVMVDAKGEEQEGIVFRQKDLQSFFDFYKASLGQRYNDSIFIGEQYPIHAKADRMIAASFPVSLAELEKRKRLVIRLQATNSPLTTELIETR